MKKIPLILTLVCTTLTWNHKTLAAEQRGDSSSNPFISSDDRRSSPTEQVFPERAYTPPPFLVVSQLEQAASESWDAERERLSKSATSFSIKSGVSSAKKVGVPDDENEALQQFLFESITSSSPPKPQGEPKPKSLREIEEKRRYEEDLAKAMALSSPVKPQPLDTPLSSPMSLGSSPKKEERSSKLTGSSGSVQSPFSSKQARVVAQEDDDGLQEALRQIAALEENEAAEKKRKQLEEKEAAEKERKLADEKRLAHDKEKEAVRKQLEEVRKKKTELHLQVEELSKKKTELELQVEELREQESALSTVYLDLLMGPKDVKTSDFESPTSIKSRPVSSPEGGSSVKSSNGSSMTPLPSSAIPRSNTSSDSHSSDSSVTGDDKK